MPKTNKKKVKRKLSKKKILIFVITLIIVFLIIRIFDTKITNIYISGNNYLTDQEIIDISKLSNYPNSISNLSFNVQKRLKKNKYICDAKVNKNWLLNEVYIEVEENYPLFYYSVKDKTVLLDGSEVDDKNDVFILTNEVPIEVYQELLEQLKKINIDILNRISEMQYNPTKIENEESKSDDENSMIKDRFFLLMSDGNYVYITLDKFKTLNKYLDIIKYFDGEKGILNLDSGGYFDVFDD